MAERGGEKWVLAIGEMSVELELLDKCWASLEKKKGGWMNKVQSETPLPALLFTSSGAEIAHNQ